MLLERRDLVRLEIEPPLVGRKRNVAYFPPALRQLLPAASIGRDRIQMGESIRFGYVPDPATVVVPASTIGARTTDPGRVAGRLERRDFSGGVDRFQQTRLVVSAEGVDQTACTGVVPAEQIVRPGGGIRRKRLEPGECRAGQCDEGDPPLLLRVADFGAYSQLLGVPASGDVLRNVRRARTGTRSASNNEQRSTGRRDGEIRDLLTCLQVDGLERQ